jgi:hypothetical protein
MSAGTVLVVDDEAAMCAALQAGILRYATIPA